MALPPLAVVAMRYGAVALAGYAVTRGLPRLRRDQRVEDAMDDLPEGVSLSRDAEASRGAWRFKRILRVGEAGPGVEVDITALARLRLRPLRSDRAS